MKTDNKVIFEVIVSTRETVRPDVIVKQWAASDVFNTIDEAVAAGKKALHDRFKEMREFFGEHWDVDEIADEVDYRFIVYEYDPGVQRNPEGFWEQYAEWIFNHEGNLLERTENRTVRTKRGVERYSTVRFPGEDAEDAGSKFEIGEFVTLANDKEELVYVVGDVPDKRENWPKRHLIWTSNKEQAAQPESGENWYTVSGFDSAGLYTHDHPHEAHIRPYGGEVPADHPLQLLRRIFCGEISISEELFDAMFERRIRFDYEPKIRSWRDIPEFKK